MGRGNYYPPKNGGVLFLDYDREESRRDLIDCLVPLITKKTSFEKSSGWINRETEVIAENKLFYLGLSDNEWSFAIVLSPKDEDSGLSTRHKKTYMRILQAILLDQYGEIGVYATPYTHRTITKEESQ